MTLTQNSFEKLVESFHSQQTESATLDCKEELWLDQDGDKASFIRDIAALANNVIESYLIIGIINKTWVEIGLSTDSYFLDPDQTQSRMNQILGNRLDPQLSIRYQVFDLKSKKFGVVSVEGKLAPYVISIENEKYGGSKTKGMSAYIFRGVFYVRHGDTTSIANRQSRLFEIIGVLGKRNNQNTEKDFVNGFITKNNYLNEDEIDFGHNSLSSSLDEIRMEKSGSNWNDVSKAAQSWVSFAYIPTTNECKIDTTSLVSKMQPDKRIERLGSWFNGLPKSVLEMLLHAQGNPKIFSGKWSRNDKINPKNYSLALNIQPDGVIHFISTYPLFYERENVRFFGFDSLIGYFWQITYLARAIYLDANYQGEIFCNINMIGTEKTILADFAPGWLSPFDDFYPPNPREICQEKNIAFSRKLSLVTSTENEIEKLVINIATGIGKYFGQEIPRCFIPNTFEFPIKDYMSKNC